MFGLKDSDLEEIKKIISDFKEVEVAYMFGSRAKGNYRHGSDVDIALKGKDLTFSIVSSIAGILNEDTLMPYKFDVLNYYSISNKELVEHIDRVGVVFWENL